MRGFYITIDVADFDNFLGEFWGNKKIPKLGIN